MQTNRCTVDWQKGQTRNGGPNGLFLHDTMTEAFERMQRKVTRTAPRKEEFLKETRKAMAEFPY